MTSRLTHHCNCLHWVEQLATSNVHYLLVRISNSYNPLFQDGPTHPICILFYHSSITSINSKPDCSVAKMLFILQNSISPANVRSTFLVIICDPCDVKYETYCNLAE